MTPAQRHREEVFRRFADERGQVRCHWHPAAEDPGDAEDCRGRLQACHIISANRLTQLHKRAVYLALNGREHNEALAAVELDELLADGRNGVPACELHHARHEGPVLHCDPPEDFHTFVADYGLEHVVDNARSAA